MLRPYYLLKKFDNERNEHMYTHCRFNNEQACIDYFIEQSRRNLEFFRQGAIEGQFNITVDPARMFDYQQDNTKPLGISLFWYPDKAKPMCDGIAPIWLERATIEQADAMLEALRREFELMGYKQFKPYKQVASDDTEEQDNA